MAAIGNAFSRNPEEWKKISEGFEENWQSPHTIAAMDGKHVVMQASIFLNLYTSF